MTDKNELMIGELVFKYTEKGTFLYIEGDENEALLTLNSVTDNDIDNMYLTHDFNEEPVFEINSSLYYFGDPNFSREDESLAPSPNDPIGGGGGYLPPSTPLNNHRFCNSSSNVSPVTQNYGHWTGGIRNTSYIYFENGRRMKGKVWSTS